MTVVLPDGATADGKVTSVGAVAEAPRRGAGRRPDRSRSLVALTDRQSLGDFLDQAPVDVTFTAAERKDVLTVPVAALVALAEGGYGVEVVDGGTTRFVAVETGHVRRRPGRGRRRRASPRARPWGCPS